MPITKSQTFNMTANESVAETMHTTDYYFESHITIDPVLDPEKLQQLKDLVKPLGFRVAKLFMQKGDPSNLDSFMTAHSKDYTDILRGTLFAVNKLEDNGFGVRRYKIENILLDIKV